MKNNSLIIQISKDERLITDKICWIYQRTIKIKNKNEWKNKWFYPNLEIAYYSLLDSLLMSSEKESVKEALEETVEKIENIKKEIKKDAKK